MEDWYEDEDIIDAIPEKDDKQVVLSLFGFGNWKNKSVKEDDPNKKNIILFDFTTPLKALRTAGAILACVGVVIAIIVNVKKKKNQKTDIEL